MHLSTDDVAQIVNEVWSSMLGLPVDHIETENPVDVDGPTVAASVGVSGAAHCLISLEMSAEGAGFFAATMFGLDDGAASDDDVSDAIGELTNMVGGNIKSLLPEPSSLSLPVVAHGTRPTLKVPSATKMLDSVYLCGDHPIFITVWNRLNQS